MNDRGKKGWYKKQRFYINLLFKAEGEDAKVVTWSMGVRRNPTFASFLNTSRRLLESVISSGS